ncbi:annexin D5 [Cryptomeria japonica]|uniref:annexin D5 n=1 Tax=Cryptomeria japonica TaxID=3369 RepID=UPI0027DA7573|nr:annexin D5 [Cryptomeria japonica]
MYIIISRQVGSYRRYYYVLPSYYRYGHGLSPPLLQRVHHVFSSFLQALTAFTMSSVRIPPLPPPPNQDAIELYRAFKGLGCNTKTVIEILGHRDARQRPMIRQAYQTMYADDLIRRLDSELRGNLKRAVILWMYDPADRDAVLLKEALAGAGTKDKTLVEIICSRTPSQLQLIRQAYHARYSRYVEKDVETDTSGHYQKLLLAYLSATRYEGPQLDMSLAEMDAKTLYKAGEGRMGTDEATFIQIFSTRSSAQLAATASIYHNLYKHDLEKAIKRETSGDFEYALRAILKCIRNPAKYFAKILYKSMKGIGTNDAALIRVVVTRVEMDMEYIKVEFLNTYGKTLERMISSDTSGDYRAFLLTLVSGQPK